MAEADNLKQAIDAGGAHAVWSILTEDEQRAAAVALWSNGDRDTREALVGELAKRMKFRPQAVRKLPSEKTAPRLVMLAESLPELVLFQFLFHLHMQERRELMGAFLDRLELPHDNGVLDLPEDAEPPSEGSVGDAARELTAEHGRDAVVYLATLRVADATFWKGVDRVLEDRAADGGEAGD